MLWESRILGEHFSDFDFKGLNHKTIVYMEEKRLGRSLAFMESVELRNAWRSANPDRSGEKGLFIIGAMGVILATLGEKMVIKLGIHLIGYVVFCLCIAGMFLLWSKVVARFRRWRMERMIEKWESKNLEGEEKP